MINSYDHTQFITWPERYSLSEMIQSLDERLMESRIDLDKNGRRRIITDLLRTAADAYCYRDQCATCAEDTSSRLAAHLPLSVALDSAGTGLLAHYVCPARHQWSCA